METTYKRLTRLTLPLEEPVSLEEAKLHLRLDGNDSDSEVEAFISAARDAAETYCQRPWAEGDWSVVYETLPDANLPLPLPFSEVLSVTQISYIDTANFQQIINSTDYTLDDSRRQIRPIGSWPTPSKDVLLTLSANPFDGEVPASVVQAMLLLIGDYYENRQAQQMGGQLIENRAAMFLLNQYRDNMGV